VIRKISLFAGMLALAVSGIAAAQETARDLDVYYIKEGLSLAGYNAIMIDSLGLEDALIVSPPWVEEADRSPKKWKLTNADAKWLRKSYRETMINAIDGNDGFAIVTEPGKGVLIVDIEIIALMPYAERGDKSVTTRGFGEMLVQAQFRDGSDGALLAVFEGKQDVGSDYQQNTRLNNENRFIDLFAYWGSRVRQLLDRDHGR
jgi:hypothetical protein